MTTLFLTLLGIGMLFKGIYYFSPRQQLRRRLDRDRRTMDEIFDGEDLPY